MTKIHRFIFLHKPQNFIGQFSGLYDKMPNIRFLFFSITLYQITYLFYTKNSIVLLSPTLFIIELERFAIASFFLLHIL